MDVLRSIACVCLYSCTVGDGLSANAYVMAGIDRDERGLLYQRDSRRRSARSPRRPDIFNTNKGPPFTSIDFTTVLKTGGAAIVIEGC
jgi:hypothetical protein